jgi:hypothetical protein
MARFRWVRARLAEMLPVPYFHTVFTLPHALNGLIRNNMPALIGCLFRAVSGTLQAFAKDPRHLGAEPGLLMVLHTWGKDLKFHVHIHCLITGGGLSPDQQRWISARRNDFLFPVRALSKVFRGKYLAEVERLVEAQALFTDPAHRQLLSRQAWHRKRSFLCRKAWVVYAKPPFGGPAQVIKYLGAYTHRVAISNRRLVSFRDGRVSFRYKDYKHGGAVRVMSLEAADFAKRFLQHILPKGLVRIRYGGILANCKKKRALERCRTLLGPAGVSEKSLLEMTDARTENEEPEEKLARTCPACGKVALVITERLRDEDIRATYRQIFGPRGPP